MSPSWPWLLGSFLQNPTIRGIEAVRAKSPFQQFPILEVDGEAGGRDAVEVADQLP